MKNKLMNNIGLKILSLVVAFVIWLIVINVDEPIVTRTIKDIPITVTNEDVLTNLGKCYEIVSEKSVSVTVKGRKNTVARLDASDFVAVADLEKFSITKAVPVTVSITTQYRNEPEIIDGKNNTIIIEIDNYKTNKYNLEITRKGSTSDGYYIGNDEIAASTDTIMISGPESIVSSIHNVKVAVDISDIIEDTNVISEVKAYDDSGKQISSDRLIFNKDKVYVSVKPLIEKELTVKVQTSGDVADGYLLKSITCDLAKIKVAGDKSSMAASKNVVITADVEDAVSDMEKEYNIYDYLAGSVKLTSKVSVANVKVNIEKLETKRLKFKASELNFVNLQNDVVTNYDRNQSLSVSIRGESEIIDEITIKELAPSIDMNYLNEGTQKVRIVFENLDGVEIISYPYINIELVAKDQLVEDSATATPKATATSN